MNRGILRAFEGNVRQASNEVYAAGEPIMGSQPRYGPLVWTSTRQVGNAIADATAKSADTNWGLTLSHNDAASNYDDAGIPADGSVVGLSVLMIARSAAVGASERLLIADYHASTVSIGEAPNADAGQELYFGKVINHYNSVWVPIVYTGGINNVQFKWAYGWTASTGTLYLRVTGYWQRADI